tara:strand:+ start:368 stop:667 length:300 start_codon:yes stop_codon:yes gene_type:complete
MEFIELQHDELSQVNGAFLQGAAIGAGAYLMASAFNGGFTWGGLAGATVAGTFTGGFSALAGGARAIGIAGRGVLGANGAALGGATTQIVDGTIATSDE